MAEILNFPSYFSDIEELRDIAISDKNLEMLEQSIATFRELWDKTDQSVSEDFFIAFMILMGLGWARKKSKA